MKLKINGFENEILFTEKNVNILTIKNTKCFSHILQILNDKYKKEEWTYYMIFLDIRPEKDINNDICTT